MKKRLLRFGETKLPGNLWRVFSQTDPKPQEEPPLNNLSYSSSAMESLAQSGAEAEIMILSQCGINGISVTLSSVRFLVLSSALGTLIPNRN